MLDCPVFRIDKEGGISMIKTYMILSFVVLFMGCTGTRPLRLGVTDGKFIPCPASPNCVCSQYPDHTHAIEPISYQGSAQEAASRLLAVIQGMKRAKLVTEQERYFHVEFTSAVFRFVDDAEFYIDDAQKLIHIRSAARLGYSDFGVNRKRMETIRRLFNTAAS
jgi:uncharacterized protein (DUF1499 family)